jgi:hypothetical protein
MKQTSLGKAAVAISTFACAALLSFCWSDQRGASLSIESAQARVGRPATPVSAAGVARRQNRRATYDYGYDPDRVITVPAGHVAFSTIPAGAVAVGTAAAVAATSPWGGVGTGPYYRGYYGGGPYVGPEPYVGTGIGALAARANAARAAYYGGGPVETKPYYLPRAYVGGGPWYGTSASRAIFGYPHKKKRRNFN